MSAADDLRLVLEVAEEWAGEYGYSAAMRSQATETMAAVERLVHDDPLEVLRRVVMDYGDDACNADPDDCPCSMARARRLVAR